MLVFDSWPLVANAPGCTLLVWLKLEWIDVHNALGKWFLVLCSMFCKVMFLYKKYAVPAVIDMAS